MPLFNYECQNCGTQLETFKKDPVCSCSGEAKTMKKKLAAPPAKFMEPRGPEAKERGRSVMKNQDKILRERTRNHSRDVELGDLIQTNKPEVVQAAGWLNDQGTKRRKIDDI
jgi:hypothetical protein